jgi:hypothetical protein
VGARIGLEHAGGNARTLDCRRVGGAVGSGRRPVDPAEARGERPDTAEADGEADVRYGAVGVSQQRGRPLQPTGQEVLVRCLAEGPAELTAEVGRREMGDARERRHVERLAVAGVDEILRAEEVPGWMNERQRGDAVANPRLPA